VQTADGGEHGRLSDKEGELSGHAMAKPASAASCMSSLGVGEARLHRGDFPV